MIRFYVLKYNDRGLRLAPNILARNMRRTLEGIGKRLKKSSQTRMRKDTGKSRKSLKINVSGRGLDLELFVYSQLIQAIIDAEGLAPGKVFPPYGPGTDLFNWTKRRMKSIPTENSVRNNRRRKVSHITRSPKRRRGGKRKTGPVLSNANRRRASKENQIKRVAFLVARKIFEKGIKGTKWNKQALKANKAQIRRDVINGFIRSVRQINRGGQ